MLARGYYSDIGTDHVHANAQTHHDSDIPPRDATHPKHRDANANSNSDHLPSHPRFSCGRMQTITIGLRYVRSQMHARTYACPISQYPVPDISMPTAQLLCCVRALRAYFVRSQPTQPTYHTPAQGQSRDCQDKTARMARWRDVAPLTIASFFLTARKRERTLSTVLDCIQYGSCAYVAVHCEVAVLSALCPSCVGIGMCMKYIHTYRLKPR